MLGALRYDGGMLSADRRREAARLLVAEERKAAPVEPLAKTPCAPNPLHSAPCAAASRANEANDG